MFLLIYPSKEGKLQLIPKKNSCDPYAQRTGAQALPCPGRRIRPPAAGPVALPGLAGPTDPCAASDHPNVAVAHTTKVFGLRESPAEGPVPLPQRGWRFWGEGARAMQRDRGRAQALTLAESLLCLWRRRSIFACS